MRLPTEECSNSSLVRDRRLPASRLSCASPAESGAPRALRHQPCSTASLPLLVIRIRLETDWPVGAAGFEPLHLRIGIRSDSQPRWRNSNLRIWESDPPHSFRKSAHFTPFVGHPRLLPTRCATRPLSNGDADVRILPPQPASSCLNIRNRVSEAGLVEGPRRDCPHSQRNL
jgi:hypothetical protein